jgi:hypothetical protein
MAKRNSGKLVTVWEVVHNIAGPGAYGDGIHTARFYNETRAKAYAADKRHYDYPARPVKCDVPSHIADRWTIG